MYTHNASNFTPLLVFLIFIFNISKNIINQGKIKEERPRTIYRVRRNDPIRKKKRYLWVHPNNRAIPNTQYYGVNNYCFCLQNKNPNKIGKREKLK